MKVLITGGYGFIGSFVAEMFYAEGHSVSIIDNLSSGNKNNIQFKHEFYHLDVEDPACEDIFEKAGFDVVIHLAAQVNVDVSMNDPYTDSKYNVLGLANMLHLSQKYQVSKFVLASSAAVYGGSNEIPLKEHSFCDPISPYGINKLIGEFYCDKWMEIYGIDTLCFRFSNVFGPRQGTTGEGGVISVFVKRALEGKELTIYGDGEQTRDFVYVQDVAENIYRGVKNSLTGVYNLSTNTETSINQLIEDLNRLGNIKHVHYEKAKDGDIKHSRLDNSKLKESLGIAPLHTFFEGLEKTYDWFEKEVVATPQDEPIESNHSIGWMNWKKSFPYVENMMLLIAIYFLGSVIGDHLYMVDYQLVYIVIASFLFGKTQSLLSIGLGAAWFIFDNILTGRNLISLFIDTDSLIHISLYIFAGLAIRYVLDRKERTMNEYQVEVKAIREKYQSLNKVHMDTLSMKEELQKQILYTDDSIGTIHAIMKDLDSLNVDDIYQSTVHITKTLLKTDSAAFYVYEPTEELWNMAVCTGDYAYHPVIDKVQHQGLMKTLKTNETFINKDFNEKLPSMIVPVLIHDQVVGLICIDQLEFEYLSLFYANLMKILAELVGSSLKLAHEHQEKWMGTGIHIFSPKAKVVADV